MNRDGARSQPPPGPGDQPTAPEYHSWEQTTPSESHTRGHGQQHPSSSSSRQYPTHTSTHESLPPSYHDVAAAAANVAANASSADATMSDPPRPLPTRPSDAGAKEAAADDDDDDDAQMWQAVDYASPPPPLPQPPPPAAPPPPPPPPPPPQRPPPMTASTAATATTAAVANALTLPSVTLRSASALFEAGKVYDTALRGVTIEVRSRAYALAAAGTAAASSSPSTTTTTTTGGGGGGGAAAGAGAAGGMGAKPHLGPRELLAARPHPNAVFVPDEMQWVVVRTEAELLRGVPPEEEEEEEEGAQQGREWESERERRGVDDEAPVWMTELDDVEIPPHEQAKPTLMLPRLCAEPTHESASGRSVHADQGARRGDGDAAAAAAGAAAAAAAPVGEPPIPEVVTRWRHHVDPSYRRGSVLSSAPGAIPGLVPASLLDDFRRARLEAPPEGQGAAACFAVSMAALLRVVGNAADGERRAPQLASHFLTSSLRYDAPARRILHLLGFRESRPATAATGTADATTLGGAGGGGGGGGGKAVLLPPDVDDELWNLRLRRAWLELQAWRLCNAPDPEQLEQPLNLPDSTIPCEVVLGSASGLKRLFGWTPAHETSEYRSVTLSPRARTALSRLGVSADDSDDVVLSAYRANVAANPDAAVRLFQALVTVWEEQRPRSDAFQFAVASGKSEGLYTERELEDAYLAVCGWSQPYEHNFRVADASLVELYRHALHGALTGRGEAVGAGASAGAGAGTGTAEQRAGARCREVEQAMRLIAASRGWPDELREAIAAIDEGLDEEDATIPAHLRITAGPGGGGGASATLAPMDVAQARRTLGFEDNDPDDEYIVNVFPFLKETQPLAELRRAVSALAEHRDSDVLRQLAADGDEADIAALGIMSASATWSHPGDGVHGGGPGGGTMELERARRLLGLDTTTDADDEFVAEIFPAMVAESAEPEELRRAMRVYAEHRDSARLRSLCVEEAQAAYRSLPAGLDNIGNTCYLNSVLQYFFAIRQLRERVLEAGGGGGGGGGSGGDGGRVGEAGMELAEAATKSGKNIVAGGRKVSPREVERSIQFVRQLSQLFHSMIHTPRPSVRPEHDLAYLALVSSQVEEVGGNALEASEAGPAGPGGAGLPGLTSYSGSLTSAGGQMAAVAAPTTTGGGAGVLGAATPVGSSGTDATLVDDPMPMALESSTTSSAAQGSNAEERMADAPPGADEATVAVTLAEKSAEGHAGDVEPTAAHGEADVGDDGLKMSTSPPPPPPPSSSLPTLQQPQEQHKPPPLPPRPDTTVTTAVAAPMYGPHPAPASAPAAPQPPTGPARKASLMQLGAQQDVGECLDNVMYQVEVALAPVVVAPPQAKGGAGDAAAAAGSAADERAASSTAAGEALPKEEEEDGAAAGALGGGRVEQGDEDAMSEDAAQPLSSSPRGGGESAARDPTSVAQGLKRRHDEGVGRVTGAKRLEKDEGRHNDDEGDDVGDDWDLEGDHLLSRLFTGRTCQKVSLLPDDAAADDGSPGEIGVETADGAEVAPAAVAGGAVAPQHPPKPAHPKHAASEHSKRELFKMLPINVVGDDGWDDSAANVTAAAAAAGPATFGDADGGALGRDIYDGLDGFFEEEEIWISSGKRVRRNVTLLNAPPILQLHLQRVQYDRVRGAYKSKAQLRITERLYMDRYLELDARDDADAARLAKRQQTREARRRIEELRRRLAQLRDEERQRTARRLGRVEARERKRRQRRGEKLAGSPPPPPPPPPPPEPQQSQLAPDGSRSDADTAAMQASDAVGSAGRDSGTIPSSSLSSSAPADAMSGGTEMTTATAEGADVDMAAAGDGQGPEASVDATTGERPAGTTRDVGPCAVDGQMAEDRVDRQVPGSATARQGEAEADLEPVPVDPKSGAAGVDALRADVDAELVSDDDDDDDDDDEERLQLERAQVLSELLTLRARVAQLWRHERRAEYVLVSVFMHRGEATHGHYFLHQRRLPDDADEELELGDGDDEDEGGGSGSGTGEAADAAQGRPRRESTWFKYNDSVVTRVPVSEVLRDTTGATPYLLCYVRRDLQRSRTVFETLKRELDDGAAAEAGG